MSMYQYNVRVGVFNMCVPTRALSLISLKCIFDIPLFNQTHTSRGRERESESTNDGATLIFGHYKNQWITYSNNHYPFALGKSITEYEPKQNK